MISKLVQIEKLSGFPEFCNNLPSCLTLGKPVKVVSLVGGGDIQANS
jgi:hypothetical protein